MEIVVSIFALLGGIGVLMVGMNMMSSGLENAAESGVKKLLQKITNNKFAAFGVGIGVTAIIQSSTATTVLSIGFVNAGIMSLTQAASVIMGANIGTTITGIMSAFSAFDFSVYLGALALIGIFLKMFSKNDKVKIVGTILSGLGLVFIGLELMSNSFKNQSMTNFIGNMFETVSFPLLLLLLSALLTAVIQSSSATLGIIIAMAAAGVVPMSSAFFIALGADIGTCFTGIIVSANSSINAKRTAYFQLIFNLIGVAIFTPIVWVFKDQIVKLFASITSEQTFQVVFFHASFNILSALLMLPFVNLLVKLVVRIVPDRKKDMEEKYAFKYVDALLLKTPNVALEQTKKEIIRMLEMAKLNFENSTLGIINKNLNEEKMILDNEESINFLNEKLTEFIVLLSSKSLTKKGEKRLGSYHHVINDIERIGDYGINFLEFNKDMIDENIIFTSEANSDIEKMYNHIVEMFDLTINVFKNNDVKKLDIISSMEAETDKMKKDYNRAHYSRIISGSCSNEIGKYFYGIISGLERVADHLTNIAYSIVDPSGNEITLKTKKI